MKNATLRFVLTSLSFVAILSGCTLIPVGGPSSEEQAAVMSGKAAIVLFKAASKNVKVWALEMTGGAEPPRWPQNRAPSSELKDEGWRYLVLAPGNYRVWARAPRADHRAGWVTPPTGGQSGFRLNVPRGQPLLYAGDLWNFTAQADKTEMAQAVARTAFPEYGPLNVAPMSLYGSPIESGLLHELSPIALSSVGEKGFALPDWWKVAVDKGYLAPSEWALGSAFAPSDWGLGSARGSCYGSCGGELLALIFGIAYLPIGATLSAVDASLAEDKWAPCMEALARELGERDPLVDLSLRLQEKLRERGLGHVLVLEDADDVAASAARQGFKGILEVAIQRVQLRACGMSGTFCFEVVVRARLLDTRANEPVYDTIFAYSNPRRRIHDSTVGLAYSEFVIGSSECRELAAICGEDARQLFRTELMRAFDALVKNIVPESPETSG